MNRIAGLLPMTKPDDAVLGALHRQAHLVGHFLGGVALRQVINHTADFAFWDSSSYHITQLKIGTEPLLRISM